MDFETLLLLLSKTLSEFFSSASIYCTSGICSINLIGERFPMLLLEVKFSNSIVFVQSQCYL